MRVLQITSEAVPFAKTGGLADVTGALSTYLATQGHDVTLVLPLYRAVREAGFEPGPPERNLGPAELGVEAEASIRSIPHAPGLTVRFVDAPDLFDREGLYGTSEGDFPDNMRRFSVLCRAALCALDAAPDIVHVHDWQTSLAPVLLQAGVPAGAAAFQRSSQSGFSSK